MMSTSKEDGKSRFCFSDRKMVGEEDLRTMECLRGRLLAERQASRIANENAELVEKKLIELQNQLKEEIKLKNKSEKKFNFLKRKLESLKPSSVSVESEQSSSSENSETSKRQSSTNSSSNVSEVHEPKAKVKDSESPQVSSQNQLANSTTSEKIHESDPFTEDNSTAHYTSSPCSPTSSSSSSSSLEFPSPEYPIHKSEDSRSGADHISPLNLKSSVAKSENGDLDCVDNTLALVPMSIPANSQISTTDLKPVSESVREVLDALRKIRENLQSSMEKRHRIGVNGTTDHIKTSNKI